MTITALGEPFSTKMGSDNRSTRMIVCECNECSSIFCLRLQRLNKQKSCGCISSSTVLEVNCAECNKLFNKKVSQIRKTANNYCSSSCAAKRNNRTKVKRKREGECHICKKPIHSKLKYCEGCRPSNQYNLMGSFRPTREKWYKDEFDRTLQDAEYTHLHRSSAFAQIREKARRLAKDFGYRECCICGYDLHIEIAHIKSISDFSKDTMVSVVNHPDNLAPLCCNCHWEFDNNFISNEELSVCLSKYIKSIELK